MIAKSIVICLVVAAAAAKVTAKNQEVLSGNPAQDLTVQVSTIDNIESYRARNPNVNVTPLQLIQNDNVNYYYVGSRVAGDSLVGTVSDSQSWPSAQNVQVLIQYPRSGLGAIITYASVTVSQSSNIGNAYIISGGYGQRHIAVLVEAKSTSYISYSAQIYGR